MSNLYDRYAVSSTTARNLLDRVKSDDDANLAWAAFHAHQAIELLLRHILNCRGVRYQHTHDIGELIGLAVNSGFEFPNIDRAIMLSPNITAWYNESRYSDEISASAELVKSAIMVLSSLNYAYLESTKKVSSVSSKVDMTATWSVPGEGKKRSVSDILGQAEGNR